MGSVQDIIGNNNRVLSEQVSDILTMLSWNPYMSVNELASCIGRGTTSTRKHVTRAEQGGLLSHVLHNLDGRKRWRRYMLTGEGVRMLARVEEVCVADVMDRPGTTGRALATYHRRIDVLEGVYQTAATVAACPDEPEMEIYVPRHSPLDGLVLMPEDRSFGVIVKRPAIDDRYFGKTVWRYGAQIEHKPSALLIVAPNRLAEHDVQRLVERNWDGRDRYWITSMEDLGDPDWRVWWKPDYRDDDEEEFWTMPEILESLPEDRLDEDDLLDAPYKRAALPRRGWSPRIVLTPADRQVLYAIADWPLARESVIAQLAGLKPSTLPVVLRRLRSHGLVDRVETRFGEMRWALTDRGLRHICSTVRAADGKVREYWSSRKGDDDGFIGTKLDKLNDELLHTDMVHELIARVAGEAEAAVDVEELQILPAHHTERRPIAPDARIDLESASGARHVILLEAERGKLSRSQMRARFGNYSRLFETREFRDMFPARPRIAVVLEDPGAEANFSRAQVEAGRTYLPMVLTNMHELSAPGGGFLQAVWRRPGEYGERSSFWE